MEEHDKIIKRLKFFNRILSYILVATVASAATWFFCPKPEVQPQSKLSQLQQIIETRFIGEIDPVFMQDMAAQGMVASLGDPWSYYISAADYNAYKEQSMNAYVGIGVTVILREDNKGFDVIKVEPDSGAEAAGLQPGDIISLVEGQPVADLGMEEAKNQIRGEEHTFVTLTILRGETSIEMEVERKTIKMIVVRGQMLESNIGLVTIENFDTRCYDETVAAIEQLLADGAQSLIFDVRNNPGGYKSELVKVLDYLLPEGDLFRSLDYQGKELVDTSDDKCLKMPMAVLMNGESYSAAEFFAAALEEYDWATTVGEQTCGKGYFQRTYKLNDGSAVGLSVGKYFTPKGVSLADVGGLTPKIPVEVDEATAAAIYADRLDPMEDPQVLAAIKALK